MPNLPEVPGFSNSLKDTTKTIYDNTIEISISIDKLVLMIEPPPELVEGMASFLYGWLGDKEMMQSRGLARTFGAGTRRYKINICGRVPSADGPEWSEKTGFLLQADPKNAGIAPIRLDINPLCLNPQGLGHLRMTLKLLNIDWHWVQQARVTRVDTPLDVKGCTPDDFVWDIRQRPSRNLHVKDGRLLTLYLGSKYGHQVAIYDKGRQLKAGSDVRWTRIEPRIVGSVSNLQDLPALVCPLKNLLVFNPAKLPSIYPPLQSALKIVGQAMGLKGILSVFKSSLPASLVKDLEASTPPWWNPEEIWSKWPSALKASLPDLFEISPPAAALMASYKQPQVAAGVPASAQLGGPV